MIFIDTGAFLARYLRNDEHVSFTDCISIVLMKREKINRIFSFDRLFEFAGFHLVR